MLLLLLWPLQLLLLLLRHRVKVHPLRPRRVRQGGRVNHLGANFI